MGSMELMKQLIRLSVTRKIETSGMATIVGLQTGGGDTLAQPPSAGCRQPCACPAHDPSLLTLCSPSGARVVQNVCLDLYTRPHQQLCMKAGNDDGVRACPHAC